MTKTIKKYKWDIAISLSKQDIDFAKKLVKSINPSLKVFFYEDRQDELISKSGPEAFANVFKEQSRIVVILSRKEWGQSFYTEIERNAIIDRTAVKDEGYQFLMIIPMAHQEVPSWYPSTRIYADPHRFTIEELARFIEFKVTEEGGSIKPITVEDRYQNLLQRINNKKEIVRLQETEKAIKSAKEELIVLKDCFNSKIDLLRKDIIYSISYLQFNEYSNTAYFGIEDYLLECKIILPDEIYQRITSSQDFLVSFEIYKTYGNNAERKTIETERRLFYFTEQVKGWALQNIFKTILNRETLVLFRNRKNEYYDLIKTLNTTNFVDEWFQKLLSVSTESIEQHL